MKRILTTLHLFISGFLLLLISAFLLSTASNALAKPETGTIKGVVNSPWVQRYPALVYIDHVNGTFPPPAKKYHVSQKNLTFSPHINPILLGTDVDFTNDDNVVHNVFTPPGSASRFNLGNYGHGVHRSYTFKKLGVSTLLCAVHPEMLAFVIVLQNPYYALSDNAGNFKIENVPPGTYTLKFWNEKLESPSQTVTVTAGKTADVTFKDLKRKE
jgi:plastocyanin